METPDIEYCLSDFNTNIHFNCSCPSLNMACIGNIRNNETQSNNIFVPEEMQNEIFNRKSVGVYKKWIEIFLSFIEKENIPENFDSVLKFFFNW